MLFDISWKVSLWAVATAISAGIFGYLGHTWMMAGIGSTIPSGLLAMGFTIVNGDILGLELMFRLLGAAFAALFEAMG
jgi:hypothetical protein